jgi:hypothetical protein
VRKEKMFLWTGSSPGHVSIGLLSQFTFCTVPWKTNKVTFRSHGSLVYQRKETI